MSLRFSPWLAAAAGLALLAPSLVSPARAQGVRELFDFEQDPQGFTAILIKDGSPGPDPMGGLSVTNARDQVKSGSGTLTWSYKAGPGELRALVAQTRLPDAAQKLELWVKCSAQTALVLSLSEEDGSSYHLSFHVPHHEWTRVAANLDELTLEDGSQDENGKVDPGQVNSIRLLDIASLLVNAPGLGDAPELRAPRQVWLDDLRFPGGTAPVSSGPVKVGADSAFLVDNFEGEIVRWSPMRVTLAQPPAIEAFPEGTSLKLLKEAAGPGMARTAVEAGGRGLRYTYNRAGNQAYALFRDLGRADVSKADRFKLSLRVSQRSLLLVSVKERDGSEYQHTLAPEKTEGWQTLDLALADLSLGGDSKDENNRLDPDQIKEIAVIDASAFAGGALGTGDTTLELDAVWFSLR